eukprot:Pgem_evm1s16451
MLVENFICNKVNSNDNGNGISNCKEVDKGDNNNEFDENSKPDKECDIPFCLDNSPEWNTSKKPKTLKALLHNANKKKYTGNNNFDVDKNDDDDSKILTNTVNNSRSNNNNLRRRMSSFLSYNKTDNYVSLESKKNERVNNENYIDNNYNDNSNNNNNNTCSYSITDLECDFPDRLRGSHSSLRKLIPILLHSNAKEKKTNKFDNNKNNDCNRSSSIISISSSESGGSVSDGDSSNSNNTIRSRKKTFSNILSRSVPIFKSNNNGGDDKDKNTMNNFNTSASHINNDKSCCNAEVLSPANTLINISSQPLMAKVNKKSTRKSIHGINYDNILNINEHKVVDKNTCTSTKITSNSTTKPTSILDPTAILITTKKTSTTVGLARTRSLNTIMFDMTKSNFKSTATLHTVIKPTRNPDKFSPVQRSKSNIDTLHDMLLKSSTTTTTSTAIMTSTSSLSSPILSTVSLTDGK